MPYLNWKERSLRLQAGPHARLGTELAISLGAPEREELAASLVSVFAYAEGGIQPELRVDLPAGWSVFFKLRAQGGDESRLLVAHPETDAWVATLALSQGHAAAFLGALSGLGEAGELRTSELGAFAGVSNCELVLRIG